MKRKKEGRRGEERERKGVGTVPRGICHFRKESDVGFSDTTADTVWWGLKVFILTHHGHPKELVDSRSSSPTSHVTLP